jgi:hypothetical protein
VPSPDFGGIRSRVVNSGPSVDLGIRDHIQKTFFFWFKWVLDRDPEQRESKLTVLCLLIIIILISYIIYYIIIKLLIMESHLSRNRNSQKPYFLCNIIMSPISWSVTLHWARKVCYWQTLQILDQFVFLLIWESETIFTKTYLVFNLIMSPISWKGLPLTNTLAFGPVCTSVDLGIGDHIH